MTIMTNDRVRIKNDPRHIGVVRGFFSGNIVKVLWGESEWQEFIHRDKIERVPIGTDYMMENRK